MNEQIPRNQQILATLSTLDTQLAHYLLDMQYDIDAEFYDGEKEWGDDDLKRYQALQLPVIELRQAILEYIKHEGITRHQLLYGVTPIESLK
jgi:hypothetical protein